MNCPHGFLAGATALLLLLIDISGFGTPTNGGADMVQDGNNGTKTTMWMYANYQIIERVCHLV